jgi:hypothetical protein
LGHYTPLGLAKSLCKQRYTYLVDPAFAIGAIQEIAGHHPHDIGTHTVVGFHIVVHHPIQATTHKHSKVKVQSTKSFKGQNAKNHIIQRSKCKEPYHSKVKMQRTIFKGQNAKNHVIQRSKCKEPYHSKVKMQRTKSFKGQNAKNQVIQRSFKKFKEFLS